MNGKRTIKLRSGGRKNRWRGRKDKTVPVAPRPAERLSLHEGPELEGGIINYEHLSVSELDKICDDLQSRCRVTSDPNERKLAHAELEHAVAAYRAAVLKEGT